VCKLLEEKEKFMKINGSHKFKASSQSVFNAILDPSVLQSCIPGCDSVEYLDANRIKANVALPLPGLKGVFAAVIDITERREPNKLTLQLQRAGRVGSINATGQINITDESDGALLTYNAIAEMEGAIAMANNPVGQGITKNSLNSFFERLDKVIA
jgi:carbon monoxide dehydrogenase subunit G